MNTNNNELKIKIFSTHSVGSNNYVLRNSIFDAVRGGAYKEKEHDMLADCDGDNISEKNSSYCELTTQYWAWKNVDADYYGFVHYRRLFSFAKKPFKLDSWSMANFEYLNDSSVEELGLNDVDYIKEFISGYDAISPVPVNLNFNRIVSVYDQYKIAPKLHIEDIDLMLDIIKELAPKYYEAAKKYFKGSICYLCNAFIMKKELFFEYSEFLFTVLNEFDKRRDYKEYNKEAYRTPGHLGERLFGVFFTYLKDQKKYRLGERELVLFKNTDAIVHFKPAYDKNNIPIIFACNEFYAQFCSAAICSIISNSSSENNYDIFILCKEMPQNIKSKFLSMIVGRPNFSIRFCDVGSFFATYHLFERPNISMETYYRLVVPEIFSNFTKVLYLDGDLVVLDDVANLFNIDIGNNYLGAAFDISHQGNLNGGNPEMIEYYSQFGCKDPRYFINAGVLIINISMFRENFSTKFLLDFAQNGNFMFQDQDLLNILCEGRIYDIGYEWNFYGDPIQSFRGWYNSFAPQESYNKYLLAKNNKKIIHFAGNEKPWLFPHQEYAEFFWKYFRMSPFYEMFIMQNFAKKSVDKSLKKAKKYNRGKFGILLPKGSRRREFVKKVICFITHKTYIEPNYEVEGIPLKNKKKKSR